MKIKDIVVEQGFWGSYVRGLLPAGVRTALDAPPLSKPTDKIKAGTKQSPGSKPAAQPAATSAATATASVQVPGGQRLKTTNPQKTATFYKYPSGVWTDEFGNSMPKSAWATLEKFADQVGQMEPIPAPARRAVRGRSGARRAK